MMYYVNKIVMGLANPVTVGLVMLLVALVCGMMRRRRVALGVGTVGFLWMLVWTHPMLLPDWDRQLEAEYPPVSAESMPKADVIVILGGGMSKGKDGCGTSGRGFGIVGLLIGRLRGCGGGAFCYNMR